MPTNDKEYMKNYMSKYNNTEKNMEYKRSYYEKNKEHIKKLQRQYYHKHKNDPNYSHYLEYRLDLQKKAYQKKKPYCTNYYTKREPRNTDIKINNGKYTIVFL